MACKGGRPVPNDEYCRVVLVNASVMVNTVVAGGVEQPLYDCRQLADGFGMYPKLVDGIQLMHSCIPAQGERGVSTRDWDATHSVGGKKSARGR